MLVELLIILLINYIGIIMTEFFKIPMPSIIVSMALLFILIQSKLLKISQIEKTADILMFNMTILFLPATVKLIDYIPMLKAEFFKIIILLVVTTVLTIIVTAKIVHYMIIYMERSKR